MGNTCKGILNKDANNEIQFENKKLCEKETKTVLRFMLDHIVAKRTQLDKNNISQQVTHIVNNFENITEDNMKNLKDFQQLFLELSRKSKEKFTKLNIEYYGIFDFESLLDRDDSILSFTKELITNYYCHLISENETLLSRFISYNIVTLKLIHHVG
jgi:hypothetical protein